MFFNIERNFCGVEKLRKSPNARPEEVRSDDDENMIFNNPNAARTNHIRMNHNNLHTSSTWNEPRVTQDLIPSNRFKPTSAFPAGSDSQALRDCPESSPSWPTLAIPNGSRGPCSTSTRSPLGHSPYTVFESQSNGDRSGVPLLLSYHVPVTPHIQPSCFCNKK